MRPCAAFLGIPNRPLSATLLQHRQGRAIPRPVAHGLHVLDDINAAVEDRCVGDHTEAARSQFILRDAARQIAGAAITQNVIEGPFGGSYGDCGRHPAGMQLLE